MTVDEERLGEFMGMMAGFMTGGALCFSVLLGDEFGLYRAMAGAGSLSADEVAERADCNVRLTREWLDGQVAGGLVGYEPASDTYELSAEAAMALADDFARVRCPWHERVAPIVHGRRQDQGGAYQGDGALSWGDHHRCLFSGTEWFFRTGYRLPAPRRNGSALDGVDDKLRNGAKVADVGCGHGASVVVMAEAYPKSKFWGFDFHAPSIKTSKARVFEAGISKQTRSRSLAKDDDGQFDLILLLRHRLHDMGDPAGIVRHEHLDDDGTVLLVEPFALENRAQYIARTRWPRLLYTASSAICTPNSLLQEVGLGLGAQAGPANSAGHDRRRILAFPGCRRDTPEPHHRSAALRSARKDHFEATATPPRRRLGIPGTQDYGTRQSGRFSRETLSLRPTTGRSSGGGLPR